MTTIKIIPEINQERNIYRAICGQQETIGATPGQALDSMEVQLTTLGQFDDSQMLIIMSRFRPDQLFTKEQQNQLQELMLSHHQAVANQQHFSGEEELTKLVEAEFEAAIERSRQLISEIESN